MREAAGHLIFRGEGSTNGAIALYRAVFREGPVGAADAFELLGIKLPTIVRELREESAEGEVIKFLSRIERTTTVGPHIRVSRRASRAMSVVAGRSTLTTCPHACTPASVRPAPTGSSAVCATRSSARRSSPITVRWSFDSAKPW